MDILVSFRVLKEKLTLAFPEAPPIDLNLLSLENIDKIDGAANEFSAYLLRNELDAEVKRELDYLTSKLAVDADNYPFNRMKEICFQYFSETPNVKNITFLKKTKGVQIGTRAEVEYQHDKKIMYYIKTHMNGVDKNFRTLINKPVNLYEALIYKILHLAGMSPQPLFIFADMRDFYIATKDAGYNDNSETQHLFLTYEQVSEQYPSLLQSPVARKGFIKADILSRVLSITDVLTNPSNIGFIIENDQLTSFKIIDLSPWKDNANYQIFLTWMNGVQKVRVKDQHILSVLKYDDRPGKLLEAEECFNELLDIPKWLEEATEYINTTVGTDVGEDGIRFIKYAWNALYAEFTNQLSIYKMATIDGSSDILE